MFNLAVGGSFPSIWDINGISALSAGQTSMYVDFVKVYQKGTADETFHGPAFASAVEMVQPAGRFTVAPNPVHDVLHVAGDFRTLTLYSLDGRAMLTASSADCSVASLPAGVYVAVITAEDGHTERHKLIKK